MNKQRGFFALPALAAIPLSWWICAGLGVALLVSIGIGRVSYNVMESKRDKALAEVAELKADRDASIAIAKAWEKRAAANLAQIQTDVDANQRKNDATITSLKSQADALRGRNVRLSADLARVLNDAAVAANASHSAAPAVDQGTTSPVPNAAEAGTRLATYDEGELGAWVVGAATAYASCRIKHAACVRAYESIQTGASP